MEDDDAFYNAKKIVDQVSPWCFQARSAEVRHAIPIVTPFHSSLQYVVIRRREDGTQEKLILSVERDLVKKVRSAAGLS